MLGYITSVWAMLGLVSPG